MISIFRNMRRWWLLSFPLVALYGQSDLATVTGVVTDPTLAVVPAVTIAIRNAGTNITRTTRTNEAGYFTVTDLPPGSYDLAAEKQGFRTYREVGIVLQVGQTLRSDVRLSVGEVNESVNVVAQAAALNTENGAIKGDVISETEIHDLPLNGRNFTDLAFLVPGVLPAAQGGQGTMNVNGARADNTNFYIDGYNNRNVRGGSPHFSPSIDAMQEFKMESSGYSAEYGKVAGGLISMALRSGTNQYHGSLWDYFRNNTFDARGFFDTSILGLHQNQFGGVLSGPVVLPKIYTGHDRTFFLFNWESLRYVWGQTELGSVPTALERNGNFTQSLNTNGKVIQVTDPFASNAPFAGDVIPASRFSPIAVGLLQFYPLPNRNNSAYNYLAAANNISNSNNFLGKIDHRFTDRDSVSFRYGLTSSGANTPWSGSNLGEFQNWTSTDTTLAGLDYTRVFTPSLLMEVRAGFTRSYQDASPEGIGQDVARQLTAHGSLQPSLADYKGFPIVSVLNYLSLGYTSYIRQTWAVNNIQTSEKFTWVHSSHILKWGFDYSRDQFNTVFANAALGTVTVQNQWTGDSVGDLLLGLLYSSSITPQVTRSYLRASNYGWFMNDDYKVTHSLTLNLGVRYEIHTPASDRYGRMSSFVPGINKILVANGANTPPNFNQLVQQSNLTAVVGLASDYDIPQSLAYTDYSNVAPRFGFAWRPFHGDKTVLRGGYGIFYGAYELADFAFGMARNFPFAVGQTSARQASNPNALTLANPFPQNAATSSFTSYGSQVHAPSAYVQSYNLTAERDIGGGAVVEVGFVGSKGTHLGQMYNINQPVRTIAQYEATGTFPDPVAQLGTVYYWGFSANSIYNAGQFMLRRRATGGFFYRLSYTYSKSIDDASQITGAPTGGFAYGLDPRNLRLERARSDFDRGHVLTAAFSWQVPVGRGKRFLNSAGSLTDAFLGGWQLSGTSTLSTGPPFTVEASNTNQNLGESLRPNRIASGKQVTGTGIRGIDYPWFNPSAFVNVPNCISRTNCSPDQYGFLPFAPGNSGRNILDGPGLAYVNLSLMRNFLMGEKRRIQFRCEDFNVLNHPNFLLPDRNFNETAAGIIGGVVGGGSGGPRILQLALRFEF